MHTTTGGRWVGLRCVFGGVLDRLPAPSLGLRIDSRLQARKPMASPSHPVADPNKPLEDLDHWEDFLKARYPDPAGAEEQFQPKREKAEFRDYRKEARPSVKE